MKITPFEELPNCDLVVDAIYEGSHDGQIKGEPINNSELGFGNMGGLRASGVGKNKRLVVLFSTGENKDWPDHIDLNTGQFTYYGDNRTPGHELHKTPRVGSREEATNE